MNRVESIIIGIIISLTIPLLTFVSFWWTTAFLHLTFSVLSVQFIIASAFTGLTIGIVLDYFYITSCIHSFYSVQQNILVLVYISLSVLAVGFFMGLPVGTFILGCILGMYAGRRCYHYQLSSAEAVQSLKYYSLIAACVTALFALPVGLIALNEQHIVVELKTYPLMYWVGFSGFLDVVMILVLCMILFAMQYCSALYIGIWIYKTSMFYSVERLPR